MEERNENLSEVIDRRVQVYGDPSETFERIAQVWSGVLGHTVRATDVPLMLIGMKMVRASVTPDYSDNSDDIEGYLDIFRKIVGDAMVRARSVEDYISQKWPDGDEDPDQLTLDYSAENYVSHLRDILNASVPQVKLPRPFVHTPFNRTDP